LKVIFFCCTESRRALLLPNDIALLPPVCIWRMKKNQMAPNRMNGPTLNRMGSRMLLCSAFFEKFTPAASIADSISS